MTVKIELSEVDASTLYAVLVNEYEVACDTIDDMVITQEYIDSLNRSMAAFESAGVKLTIDLTEGSDQ